MGIPGMIYLYVTNKPVKIKKGKENFSRLKLHGYFLYLQVNEFMVYLFWLSVFLDTSSLMLVP